MTKQKADADDPRFHRTLFGELKEWNDNRPPALIYVENGNAIAGYDTLALDYKMAADLLIETYYKSEFSNWFAPAAFLVRQSIELILKSLLAETVHLGNPVQAGTFNSHSLERLWITSRDWLIANGFQVKEDARFDTVEWLITNLHAVDPTGDLFRFADSRVQAFGRNKTYDRAGFNNQVFVRYFSETFDCLSHWDGVVVREVIKNAEGMSDGDFPEGFDPLNFPRREA